MPQEIEFIQTLLYAAVLLALGFILVTSVLYTLAYQVNRSIRIHNLIVETKQVRAKYMAHRARHDAK